MLELGYGLITGASSGSGECFAQALASRGRNLLLVARSKDKPHALAKELASTRPLRVEPIASDLTCKKAAAQRVLAEEMRNDRVPLPLRSEDQFDDLADRALAARPACRVVNVAAQQFMPAAHAHRQPHTREQGQIHDVVTHVTDFLVAQVRSVENALVRFEFFAGLLLEKVDAQLLGSILDHGRAPARDDAGFDSGLVGNADAQAVAGVKSLGLEEASPGTREVIDTSVSQDTVDIHQQEFDSACVLAELSGCQGHDSAQESEIRDPLSNQNP